MEAMTIAVGLFLGGQCKEVLWFKNRTDMAHTLKDIIDSVLEWKKKDPFNRDKVSIDVSFQEGGDPNFSTKLLPAWAEAQG